MPSLWIIPVKELRGRAGKSAHSKCEIGCIHSITRFVRKKQNDPSIQFHPDYKKQASQVYLVSFSLRSGSSVCQDQQIYCSDCVQVSGIEQKISQHGQIDPHHYM